MARSFQIFGKKRGHRRTGSKSLGSAGEALFFAILLVLGTAFLILLLVRAVLPEWRANHEFVEVTAIVDDKKIDRNTDRDNNPVYIPKIKIHFDLDGNHYSEVWTYDISVISYLRSKLADDRWTYDVARTQFTSENDALALVDAFEVGMTYPCWYDPLNPEIAVLVRGYRWWFWLLELIPIGFILIGGGGLLYTFWHWGKSPEHRSARGQLGRIELFDPLAVASKDFPTVPRDADLTNSPGTELKFRLPTRNSQGWRLFASTVACLCWNALVAVFIVIAIQQHIRGQGDWRLDLFVVPFLLMGGFLIYYFVRELLIATGVGPTLVEISDHPLLPGKSYALFVTQSGHLSMNSIDISLECEEQSSYRQGTDTRTDRRLVFRQDLFHREQFEIAATVPFAARCEIQVPSNVMHSFQAAHNQVLWSLVVRGDAAGWPPFRRTFPVIVYPSSTTNPAALASDRSKHELSNTQN